MQLLDYALAILQQLRDYIHIQHCRHYRYLFNNVSHATCEVHMYVTQIFLVHMYVAQIFVDMTSYHINISCACTVNSRAQKCVLIISHYTNICSACVENTWAKRACRTISCSRKKKKLSRSRKTYFECLCREYFCKTCLAHYQFLDEGRLIVCSVTCLGFRV